MKKLLLGTSRLEIELELSLVSVTAIMSSLESKEYNVSFNGVRVFVKLLILQWTREIPLPLVLLNILLRFDTL